MHKKIISFNKSELESFLNTPGNSEYIIKMAPVYRDVKDHLNACTKIAKDVFGDNDFLDAVLTVHNIFMDFLSEDGEEIVFESDPNPTGEGE